MFLLEINKKVKILFLIIFTIFSFGFFSSTAVASSAQVIVRVIPATPTGLTATPNTCGSISISWNTSVGATSYTLTDNWGAIYSGSSNSYLHTVTAGSTHAYRISASNANGTSAYSGPVYATGPAACVTSYLVSTTVSGSGTGIVTPSSRTVSGGSTTMFTIFADSGSYLDSITPSGCTGFLSGYFYYTGIINSNCNINIVFNSFYTTYLVSTSLTAGGSINPTSRSVISGYATSFEITPFSGYAIDTASGCGGSLSGSTYTTGAITSNCTVYVTFRVAGPMSGSITPSSSSCSIPAGSSSCNVNLTWSTSNPIGTSAITASGMTSVVGNSGSQSFPVPYNLRTFYLYNNGQELASSTIYSDCDATSTWNGSVCAVASSYYLTIIKAGAGYGTVTSNPGGIYCGSTCANNYAPSTHVELTPWPTSMYYFEGWSGGDCSGNGSCNIIMTSAKTVTATFSPVTVSVTASTPYYVAPSTNVTFNYTASSTGGVAECRLLDYNQSALTSYTSLSYINYTVPATPNSYGYYVQCRDRAYTSITSMSSLVTVNVVTVSVSASPTSYSVSPGSTVSFTYTPSTNIGSTQCALLDSTQTAVTPYQSASPINFAVPSAIGSYGYYVRCRNTSATSIIATSSLITVSTSCSAITSWNGTSCVLPSGTLSATDCSIPAEGSSCQTSLTWNTSYPIGTSAVTTPTAVTVASANSGSGVSWPVSYPSRIFYLYNNGNELRQATANATCASGTAWNAAEGKCKATTGNLEASGCNISEGQSTCTSNLVWTTTNPITISILKKGGTTITSGNNGSISQSVARGVTRFDLWHGGVIIDWAESTAVCAPLTEWNGTTCVLVAPKINTFSASSGTIFEGRSATLTWVADSDLVTSCTGTGFNTGGSISGTAVVTPTATTTYTLTCTRGAQTVVESLTVKVINLIIKEQ